MAVRPWLMLHMGMLMQSLLNVVAFWACSVRWHSQHGGSATCAGCMNINMKGFRSQFHIASFGGHPRSRSQLSFVVCARPWIQNLLWGRGFTNELNETSKQIAWRISIFDHCDWTSTSDRKSVV